MKKLIFYICLSLTFAGCSDDDSDSSRADSEATFETFDGTGLTLIPIADGFGQSLNAVTKTSDGKFVAAGYVKAEGDFTYHLVVVRFDANGQLDPAFSEDGVRTYTEIGVLSYGFDIVELDSGKYVVSGLIIDTSNTGFFARINSDGSLDDTFNTTGYVTVANDVRDIAQIPGTNDVVFTGYIDGDHRFGVLRDDGTIEDYKYDLNNAHTEQSSSIAVDSDGKFILGGRSYGSPEYESTLIRVYEDGILDTTFDSDGVVRYSTEVRTIYQAIDIQSDGKILAAGIESLATPALNDIFINRFLPTGELDTSFGTDGETVIDDDDRSVKAINALSDGNMLITGNGDVDFFIYKLDSTGNIDTSFGDSGKIDSVNFGVNRQCFDTIETSRGKYLCVGYVYYELSSEDIYLMALMYNEDGSLATTTFGITNTEGE